MLGEVKFLQLFRVFGDSGLLFCESRCVLIDYWFRRHTGLSVRNRCEINNTDLHVLGLKKKLGLWSILRMNN